MRPSKARFVTLCQQLLALGVVLAVLTPATTVISLDVVQRTPHAQQRGERAVAEFSAYTREAQRATKVPTAPVESEVEEYQLTPSTGSGKVATPGLSARGKVGSLDGGSQLVSAPETVTGYGAVGVTWRHGEEVPEEGSTFEVRTQDDGEWSDWTELEYHDDHGPDPDSPEAQQARPGTDVLLVGRVDEVQVRATTETTAQPRDMKLAVIEPGTPSDTAREVPAIATDEDGVAQEGEAEPTEPTEPGTDEDGLALQAATYTPRPTIYSRAQWGANERLRDAGSLRYYEVHAGFVHHTVNANNYSRADVPGIIRSIYAYHTQSRGWSDVGYNFLVDRFGRIWEGRYGGVTRPVVGAHTLGYNDYAFAMSAIGNFETAQPTSAMLQAYGSLMAWKLSLHGVSAASSAQRVGSKSFRAINGHRDAGSTACPGRYLYAKLGSIRSLAASAQRGWSGRELESNLASSVHPDLIVRRRSDGMAFVFPTGGGLAFHAGPRVSGLWNQVGSVFASPDLTSDGRPDLLVRGRDGLMRVSAGTGRGFEDPVKPTNLFVGRDLITPIGDLDGDGHNDVVARNVADAHLNLFAGDGNGGFDRQQLGGDWTGYNKLTASGDLNGDKHVDLLARQPSGSVWFFRGNGTRTLAAPVAVRGNWKNYDTAVGYGDLNRDGRADVLVRPKGGGGYVLPGNGKGGFGRAMGPFNRFKGMPSITGGGNVAGNQAPDLVARDGADLVIVTHNGRFDLGRAIPTGLNLSESNAILKAGDWDRDGHGDIITRQTSDGRLLLRRGDGKGGFSGPIRIGTGWRAVRLIAAAGDFTGDGWPDLVAQPSSGGPRIYPGRGVNGLAASFVAHSRVDAGTQVAVGRWDGDGAPDTLFRKGSRLTMMRGNGPGGFLSPKALQFNASPYDWVIGISDFQARGGHADVLVRQRSNGYLYVLSGNASGLRSKKLLSPGLAPFDLAG